MKRFYRVLFYLGGMLIQCFGVTLSTKTNLGASAIISLPKTLGEITGASIAVFNFLLYLIMVALQLLLDRKIRLATLLQIPFSFLISALIGVYDMLLPVPAQLWQRVALMAAAVLANGVGGAMMVNMRVVPNTADGLADCIGTKLGRDLGLGKNLLDLSCVALSCCMGLLFCGRIVSVGLGTVFAMIFVGRVMAAFNHFFRGPMLRLAGLNT